MKTALLLMLSLFTGAVAASAYAADNTSAAAPLFVGHKYKVRYADGRAFLFDFKSANTAQFTFLEGPKKGKQETVTFTTKEIGDGVYMLYWQEQNKTTVVHVDDFKKLHSYTNVTTAEHQFYNFESPITLIDGTD